MSTKLTTILRSTYKKIATSMTCAIVAAVSLATVAVALIVAAVNPALNGQAIATIAGLLILIMATVVTALSVVIHKFSAVRSSADLVHW